MAFVSVRCEDLRWTRGSPSTFVSSNVAERPIEQFGIESQLSWISGLSALPAKRIEDWRREYRIPHIDSHQYSA
jgi:hypothetical protein